MDSGNLRLCVQITGPTSRDIRVSEEVTGKHVAGVEKAELIWEHGQFARLVLHINDFNLDGKSLSWKSRPTKQGIE